MYKAKTLTELNATFADIFEYNIELHDSGKLSNDGLIEAMYMLQREYRIMRRFVSND